MLAVFFRMLHQHPECKRFVNLLADAQLQRLHAPGAAPQATGAMTTTV